MKAVGTKFKFQIASSLIKVRCFQLFCLFHEYISMQRSNVLLRNKLLASTCCNRIKFLPWILHRYGMNLRDCFLCLLMSYLVSFMLLRLISLCDIIQCTVVVFHEKYIRHSIKKIWLARLVRS